GRQERQYSSASETQAIDEHNRKPASDRVSDGRIKDGLFAGDRIPERQERRRPDAEASALVQERYKPGEHHSGQDCRGCEAQSPGLFRKGGEEQGGKKKEGKRRDGCRKH